MRVTGLPKNRRIISKAHQQAFSTPSISKSELKGGDEGVEKDWLVIYYGAGDNNLRDYIFADLNELEAKGSDKNLHIVALFDAGKKDGKGEPISVTPSFQGAKAFYLIKDNDPKKVNSPIIGDFGQVNLADPEFMSSFLVQAIKKYPAKHVAVIISDHGAGWLGAIEDDHPKSSSMSLKDLKRVFSDVKEALGRKLDLLGWDACLMASAEILVGLSPYVRYMVASEESEGADGWPYPNIFSAFGKGIDRAFAPKKGSPPSPRELANSIVKAASSYPKQLPTMAAFDMDETKLGEFMDKVREFSDEVREKASSSPRLKKLLFSIYSSTERFGGWFFNYMDVFDLARRVAQSVDIADKDLKAKASEVLKYKDKLIISSYINKDKHPNANGLHAESSPQYVKKEAYRETLWDKRTHWGNMIKEISNPYTRKL